MLRRRALPGAFALVLAAAGLLAGLGKTAAQQPGTLVIVGPSGHSATFDAVEIGQMPAVSVSASLHGEQGQAPTSFAGPPLWAVLNGAGAVSPDFRARMRQTVIITGRDSYTALLALAEMDPEFEGKQVILATSADGKPLGPGAPRLVVPGDRRGGRNVRDVIRIEVR